MGSLKEREILDKSVTVILVLIAIGLFALVGAVVGGLVVAQWLHSLMSP